MQTRRHLSYLLQIDYTSHKDHFHNLDKKIGQHVENLFHFAAFGIGRHAWFLSWFNIQVQLVQQVTRSSFPRWFPMKY